MLAQSVLDAMLSAARAAHPREACGILLGDGTGITQFTETANIHPTPETHFEIDPQALIDAHRAARTGGLKVMGYFHSHPVGDPEPSRADRAESAGDRRVWAIAAGETVRFWRDDPDGFEALSYALATR
ncbi:Mov34/MPN/PAD-1 family protein [Erythrobacter sp. GH1-10]|uniref:Mov34/MPN/PAD-1 family protein n=1 Tax=Erythrobacter sp. GH1-10 TaxID=3349334 RepID=UPI003878118C